MNVLIAEDDFRVAEIHHDYLKQLDEVAEVRTAANAKETIVMLEKWHVDILLLDVYLPDNLGIDMIESFQQKNTTLQIILITAATDIDILKKAYTAGVVDYLVKPIKLERLAGAIKKALHERKLLESSEEITQPLVDELFQSSQSYIQQEKEYPKGIDEITLEKVKDVLRVQEEMSAEEVGQAIGVSRTTARRYLEYLISVGKVRAELVYGIVGRPERKYVLEKNSIDFN